MNLILCCLVAFGAAAPSQPETDRAELTRLEQAWNDAHLRGDADALDRLWADGLVVSVPGMPVLSKDTSLKVLRSGKLKFTRYETSDVRVQLYGDAAIVTGRLQRARTMGGKDVAEDWRFTKVYVRQAGAWRVVAWHASPAAPD